mgnify:CR=1 FL=1
MVYTASLPTQPSRIFSVSEGIENSRPLSKFTESYARRVALIDFASDMALSQLDLPWVVLDSSGARKEFDWTPESRRDGIPALAGNIPNGSMW